MNGSALRFPLLAAATLLLMACGSGDSTETEDSTISKSSGNYLKDDYIEVPLDQYLRIKDALVSSNAQEAQAAARQLDSLWTIASPGDQLLSSVRQIAASADLEAQRLAFHSLTQAYLVSLESAPLSDSLYLQFCPMAFDYEGATWISRERKVMNPYFGDEMLNCGVVRRSIGSAAQESEQAK